MSWRREISKLNELFRRQEAAEDVNEEIRCHLKMEEQENLEAGMSQEEARYSAMRRFGNATLAQERSSEMWAWVSAETLLQDIRFGLRQLRRNPGFTTVAIVTLALGIGATTAIFSVVNSVLLRPLPYRDPARLIQLFETEEAPGNFPLSGADYLDWQAQKHSLEATALYSWTQSVSASGANEPESASVVNTQANFFDVLGVRPIVGRTFAPGEDAAGKNHVAMLSFGFWQRHFGGGNETVGKSFVLNNEPYTVIGVMPRWFNFYGATDVWTPCDMKALGPHGNHNWQAIGRLHAGVSLAQARGELLAISKRLEKQYPGTNNRVHAVLLPLKEIVVGDSKAMLLMLLGAVTLVLLVACVNVANLQLARAGARHREMAVRSSLGAGRWRMVRQLLTESVLLALSGAALGTLGAWSCVRLLEAAKTVPIPRANPVQIDGTVLLFAAGISILVGILFGLAPALQASELSLNQELKAGAQAILSAARTRQILRDGLVIAEISVTVALLVGAGLVLRSFAHLRSADIGVNPYNVLTISFNLPEAKYPTLTTRRQFFDQLIDRTHDTPGVEAAAVSTEIPLQGGSNGYINVEGEVDPGLSQQLVGWNYITTGYFRTLGIPILKGRNFSSEDLERTAAVGQKLFDLYKAGGGQLKIPADLTFVAIVSQALARTFWQNQEAVGKSFRWNDVKVTVIGVVGNVKEYGIRANSIPQAYFPLPLALAGGGYGHLTIKTRIPPAAVLGAIRSHVRSLDNGLVLFRPQTMDEVIAGDTNDMSIQTFLLGTFAILALMLAAVGALWRHVVPCDPAHARDRHSHGAGRTASERSALDYETGDEADCNRLDTWGDCRAGTHTLDIQHAVRCRPGRSLNFCFGSSAVRCGCVGGLLHSGPEGEQSRSAAGLETRVDQLAGFPPMIVRIFWRVIDLVRTASPTRRQW
jgi:putative ABC transport system permease protein